MISGSSFSFLHRLKSLECLIYVINEKGVGFRNLAGSIPDIFITLRYNSNDWGYILILFAYYIDGTILDNYTKGAEWEII